jgi:hypothetical protein
MAERDFQAALRELEAVVGRDWLFSSDEDVALYKDGYSPLWGEAEERVASAAGAPASRSIRSRRDATSPTAAPRRPTPAASSWI